MIRVRQANVIDTGRALWYDSISTHEFKPEVIG